MAEASFGERLTEARRIKGETIEEVSEQLRIRPSIILAMETNNFSHMPHKGYARNMVSSYARYLGLDSTRLTEQFLREFRRWEASNRGRAASNASSLSLASRRRSGVDESIDATQESNNGRERITAASRNKERKSVWGKDNTRDTNRRFREQLRQVQDDAGFRQEFTSRRSVPPKNPGNDTASMRQVRTNDYVGKPPRRDTLSRATTSLSSKPLLLVVGLVIAFVAILMLWAFLASTCSQNEQQNVPVTGAVTSDEGLDEDQAANNVGDIEEQIAEDKKYGPFELLVQVVEGSSWLQIDIDGSTPVGEIHDAPWESTFQVNSECRIEAGAPGSVRVFKNGIEVPLENVNGLGVLELKVEQRPIVQNAQDADTQSQE